MIAADTNLIVRHLTHDDAGQAEKVRALFDDAELRQEPVFLGHIVLCEVCWVLGSTYRFDKAGIAAGLQSLLDDAGFLIQERPVVEEALRQFRKHSGQFPDHLLGLVARQQGSSTTYTFDRNVAKHPHFTLLN